MLMVKCGIVEELVCISLHCVEYILGDILGELA